MKSKKQKTNLFAFAAVAVGAVALFFTSRRTPASSPNAPKPSAPSPINTKAAHIAKTELATWKGKTELTPAMKPRLIAYWKAAGLSQTQAEQYIANREYWSAAFICYLMQQAGAGNQFKYSVWHTVYCAAAKRNRIANNSNPFKLYRPEERPVRVGDLVCNSRDNGGVTYTNVDDGKPRPSHCDIVVSVGAGFAEVIGGNLGDTVSKKRIKTNAGGFVSSSEYYAVLKVQGSSND